MFFPWQKKFGARYGLKKAESEAAGITGNCFVVLGDGRNMKTLRIIFPGLDNADMEWLEKLLAESKLKKFEWHDREILVRFPEYLAPYPPNKIAVFLDSVLSYFLERYPASVQPCQNCGAETSCEVYAGMGAMYLCENCFTEKEEVLSLAKKEYEEKPKNYLPGFLGALLFAFPGAVLAVIFFVFLDSIAAVSTLVCMFLAQKGYRQFKGKISPAGAVLVSAAGIVMSAAGILAGYITEIVRALLEEGYTLDEIIPVLPMIMQIPELMRELLVNVATAFLISAVYIVLNFFRMVKEWRFPELKRAEEIISAQAGFRE